VRFFAQSTFTSKRWLDALVTFVGFTGLADSPDSQLRGQLVRRTQLPIDDLLQRKLVGCFLAKGDFSHIITRCIKGVHGLKQGLVLFFSWCQLQEHRLFHACSILSLNNVVTGMGAPLPMPPNKERCIPPPV